MPRCNCGAGTCACSVTAGVGIRVEGNGSTASPYQVTNTQGSLGQQLITSNTDTVDLALAASNPQNPTGPWVLSANALLSLSELTDVSDSDVPASGDVPTWNGTEWVFQAPPAGGGGGSLPPGGADGQVLTKQSSTDGDALWETLPASGGTWGTPTELTTQNLTTITTPGLYTQSTSVEATLAAEYPVAAAGLLEVFTNTTGGGTITWQRYTAHDTGASTFPSGLVFIRGRVASGWQAWRQVGAAFSAQAVCSPAVTLPVSGTVDITGLSVTVPVVSPQSVYMVTLNLDVTILTATTATFVGTLVAGGADGISQQLVWVPTTGILSGGRQPLSQTYRVTGLAAGNTIFKAQASGSTSLRVNSLHSIMTVQQIA